MRFFIAFTISLLIYLFFLWIFFTQVPEMNIPPKKLNNHVVKIDIVNIALPKKITPPIKKPLPLPVVKVKPVPQKPLKKKQVIKKKIVKKKVTKKPLKKKDVVKKIVKEKVVKKEVFVPIEEPYIEEIVYTESIFREEPIRDVVEEVIYEPYVQEELIETVQPIVVAPVKSSSDDLASFFKTPDTVSSSSVSPFPNKKIAKLYGSDFHSFTPTQKEFIENNLDSIQNITQRILTRRGYPEGAGVNGQEGTNVVSFNLHPNGDISDLHLKTYIGSRPLDNNTLDLIRTAYKDYPYPSTVTRIVFYVEYSIYGY